MMDTEMDIGELFAEQMDRLLSDSVSRELLISVEEGQAANTLWQTLDELGFLLALVDEENNGSGLSWEDVEPTLRCCGRHGAPVPLPEALLANWVLAAGGLELPTGLMTVSTTVYKLDANDQLHGQDSDVAWAPVCENIVAIAKRGDDQYVCLLSRANCQIESLETIAREPAGALNLEGVTPLALAAAPAAIGELGLLPCLASLRCVQIAGALEELLALCVEYANDRQQFGRPIGKFQAIQHAIAELASQTAAAQVAGQYACRQVDAGNAEHGGMIAKIRAGQAAGRGAEIAHQVFGAIGFTDEHSLHYLTRRLWQWRCGAGSEFWWSERLGRKTIAAGGDDLWPSIAG
jgi:acyl-CoA dehydrogenase